MSYQLTGCGYRFTFLTPRLVRMEYQAQNQFEDGLTTCVRCRDLEEVEVRVQHTQGGVEIDTDFLHIVYDEKPFSQSGLCVTLKGLSEYGTTWRFGQQRRNLGGTARTLDEADGRIELGDGLLSRGGIAVLDDSSSVLLDEQGHFAPRKAQETDLYLFGYGHDYEICLRDFYRLSGSVPMLPRYALGNWWSRYHEYSEQSYLTLMNRFAKENIPLSVAVIDMDWHLTQVPYGRGWTGYTWNRDLFPDPERFLQELHRRGMRVTLNLHPADGVQPHEEAYESMCRALNRDPARKDAIDFDVTDPAFMKGYFECLHHPLENQGVDFWWIDWQQGTSSAMQGLDPLWALNEMHYRDITRGGKRGLILSRYAGPGSHRCPVGFSGDTFITWESLDFQPEFTLKAANIGYPWWSHDIGGHMHGTRCDELAVRWLQLGVFSPILRLHSTKAEFAGKEPWTYGKAAEAIMGDCLKMRHRLIPYLYTAGERTHRLGEALVRPIYYRWPGQNEAYQVKNQYLFGPSLMVCPITQPMDASLQLGSVQAWLPEGVWFDFTTGQSYTGGRMLTLYRPLDEYPVLAPAGAMVPLADKPDAGENPDEMTLRVFAGADGEFTLYEDDGISVNSASVLTHIALDWQQGILTIKAQGELSLLAKRRVWHVECIGFESCAVTENSALLPADYDPARNALCFTVHETPGQPVTLAFDKAALARYDWLSRIHTLLERAQISTDQKEIVWQTLRRFGRDARVIGELFAKGADAKLIEALCEILFAG